MASTSMRMTANGSKYAANFIKTILNTYLMFILPIIQPTLSLSVHGRGATGRSDSLHKSSP